MRLMLCVLIIIVLLLCSFSVIIVMKLQARNINNKYVSVSCDDLMNNYGEAYMKEHAV